MNEDVIPIDLFFSSMFAEVLALLSSLPLTSHEKVSLFISWSKDVDYSYTVTDLDNLRIT